MYDNNSTNCKNKNESLLGDLIALAIQIFIWYLIGLVILFIIKMVWKFLIVPISIALWYILTLLWEEVIIPICKDLWTGFIFAIKWLIELSRGIDARFG